MDHPVIGLRCWSCSLVSGIYLRGIGPCSAQSIAVWKPGVNQAQCGTPAAHEASAGLNQPVPADGCGCGFYAYHDYDVAAKFSHNMAGIDLRFPVGIVRGWGRMHVHPDGWRSEYAEILALVENGYPRLPSVAKRYGVPLVPASAMPDIAVEFGDPVPQRYRPRAKKT